MAEASSKGRTVTDKPIKYVILSHYHAVRVLGASAYQAGSSSRPRRPAPPSAGSRTGNRNLAASRACSGR